MGFKPHPLVGAAVAALLLTGQAARAADSDLDALDLTSAPDAGNTANTQPTRVFLEVAGGWADRRGDADGRSLRRVSVDFYHASRVAQNWRAVLSDRLDHVRPNDAGGADTRNSLREAYLGWDSDDGKTAVEFGRINLRQGPGYGFNPTDFFRDGALRTVTSINPFSVRENRLGTVMLRAQQLWDGGSASVALAPKLVNAPSNDGLSLDLGATNNRNRWLLSVNQRLSERVSAQVLVYKEPDLGAQFGASVTALLGNATVAHAEWANADEPDLAARSTGGTDAARRGNRLAAGLTHTTSGKLSLTAELQYNQFALSHAAWSQVVSPAARGAYLLLAEQRQDLASRSAVMVYLTQKDLAGMRNLNLSGFVRLNAGDHSRLHWLELRYQMRQADLALQWQLNSGKPWSQYGILADRQTLQVVGTYHFQ